MVKIKLSKAKKHSYIYKGGAKRPNKKTNKKKNKQLIIEPKYSDTYLIFGQWYFRPDFNRHEWYNSLKNKEKLVVDLSLDKKITRDEASEIIESLNPEQISRVLNMIARWHNMSIENNTTTSYEVMMPSDAIELLKTVNNAQTNEKISRKSRFGKSISNSNLRKHFNKKSN